MAKFILQRPDTTRYESYDVVLAWDDGERECVPISAESYDAACAFAETMVADRDDGARVVSVALSAEVV